MKNEIIRMLIVLTVLYMIDCLFVSIFLYIFGLLSVMNVLFSGYALLVIELAFIAFFIFHLYDRVF